MRDPTTHDNRVTVRSVCVMLERKMMINKLRGFQGNNWTPFHAASIPTVGIQQYLCRFLQYARANEEQLVSSLIYLERFLENSESSLDVLSVHRLALIALVTACKYTNDNPYNNSFYARIGGLPVPELNSLELVFLSSLQFELYIHPKTYQQSYDRLVGLSSKMNTTYYCYETDKA
mmetsp:Transcript_12808/g.21880  ORF Transcript_12808/g.21880 Transcript_12808/m.21880 type:complete len:176 (+) Transcript_12808:29-556(+)